MSSDEAMSVILCTAGYDHTIRFWEALSGICTRTINFSDSQINRLCISPDKKYLAAAGHHTVKLYHIKSSAYATHDQQFTTSSSGRGGGSGSGSGSNNNDVLPILTFEGHTNNITGIGFHLDTQWMVTSSEDGTVKIWETKSGRVQRNYHHGHPVNDVVIHPNQGELISCDRGGNVRIWDLGENKCSHQLIPEEDISVASVSVATDGSLLCAGNNAGNVYVWRMLQTLDTTSLVPVCKFTAHPTYITRVLLSPDVKHLATCSADHTTRIWLVDLSPPSTSASSESLSREAKSPPRPNGSLELSNGMNGSGVSGVGLNGQPNAFALEATLQGHQRWVWDCAFSADSAYLVTACSDHYARLWELSSQVIIRQYNGHHRGAVCVALNDYSDPTPVR